MTRTPRLQLLACPIASDKKGSLFTYIFRIKSVGQLQYETLEMIGFGLTDEAAQPHLKDHAEGKTSLPMLLLQLRN